MRCSRDIVGQLFQDSLGRLGHQIGSHPLAFLLVPLMVAIVLGTGIQRLRYVDDAEYLFSPKHGVGKEERAHVQGHFPINQSGGFSPSRLLRMSRMGRVVAIARDGGSILRHQIFADLLLLDTIIQNVTVRSEQKDYRYGDLCAHWKGRCVDNTVLLLAKNMAAIENGSQDLHYPITFDSDEYKLIVIPAYLGGIARNNESDQVLDAKAATLGYFVRSDTATSDRLGRLWENAFEIAVKGARFDHIDVSHFTSETLQQELNDNLREGVPYVFLSVAVMLLFSAATSMSFDCVRSKAWLSMAGVLCTALGILAAFGVLIYCGLEFAGVNYAIPFLALGIGLDDTFVMISCWQQTDAADDVPQRLRETLRKAGISITITSLTDFLSFWMGVVTPFEAIRMFCIYIATTILFVYLIHITMFTACMAYSGYLESQCRHGLICIKVLPPSKARNRSMWYRILCTGGADPDPQMTVSSISVPGSKMSNMGKGGMAEVIAAHSRDAVIRQLKNPQPCLANLLAKWLDNFWVKLGVLCAFLVYLAVAIWGLTTLSEGLDVRKLCRYNSNASRYYDLDSRYFQQYRVQIMVSGRVKYWESETQQEVEDMLSAFENRTSRAERLLTESWLRSFLAYVQYTHVTVNTEPSFVEELRKFARGSIFELDVKFSEDGRHIEATRFLIQTEAVTDAEIGTRMMQELRALARTFAPSLQVTVFNPYFVYFDQFIMVRPYTVQCVLVAAAVMIVVATLFLPHLMSTACIALTMVSIELGVVGFMSLWGIKLDAIAMINLIMCVGFSVDYSAHVSHAFLAAPPSACQAPRLRVAHVFRTAGLPVLQGATSTVLALLPLLLVPSYISEVFFKITFLVSVLGAAHALLLLPVLLSLIQSDACRKRSASVAPQRVARATASPTVVTSTSSATSAMGREVHPIATETIAVVARGSKVGGGDDSDEQPDDDVGLGTSADESSTQSNTSTPRAETRSAPKAMAEPLVSSVELHHFTPQHGPRTYAFPSTSPIPEATVHNQPGRAKLAKRRPKSADSAGRT